MKAATTSLAQFLSTLDAVEMCPIKEPQHFCTDLYDHPDFAAMPQIRAFEGQDWVRGRAEYLALFSPTSSARYVAEASTTYLYSVTAAQEIAVFSPQARIAILLRHPVRRAFSEYLMNRKIGIARGSFSEAMAADHDRVRQGEFRLFERYVYAGLYAKQVERFLRAFPREHVFIAAIDEPGNNIETVAKDLCSFLGIEAAPQVPRLNEAGLAAYPGLNQILFRSGIKGWASRTLPTGFKSALKKLYYSEATPPKITAQDIEEWTDIFASDVRELSDLVKHDFTFWLKP